MKLNEFKNSFDLEEAESHTKASKEIRLALRKFGYKLLGSGYDATVWAKKSGPVIKIIMPQDKKGAGTAGDTFMKFYEFCNENSNLENLPKFSSELDMFEADNKNYIMVSMERLKPIPSYSFEEAMIWMLSDFATKKLSWNKVKDILNDENIWMEYATLQSHEPDVFELISKFDSLDRHGLLEYEVLYKLMVLLYHRGQINKYSWDLHTANVMQRNDGTLVIVDPWISQF